MGDGVNALFSEDGQALVPGTPQFIEKWERVLNEDEATTLNAYFPQHINQEIS